jgi:hypothetical protein
MNQHLEAESLEEVLGAAGFLLVLAGLILVFIFEHLLQFFSSVYASFLGKRRVSDDLLQIEVSGVSVGEEEAGEGERKGGAGCNLVGIRWLKLTTLTNGLILHLFSILALPIARTTLRG